jgi:hypothetical protein
MGNRRGLLRVQCGVKMSTMRRLEIGYLVQVLAENIYHQQYHHHNVGNNSSYNLGLIMLSSLMIMGSDKYSWSYVDLRTDPIHSRM